MISSSSPPSSALHILKTVFGYDQFRGHQADVIDAVVSGRDALVLMPTGGGKSLCYQVPALVRPGMAVVVSPLIALMQDQVDALTPLGVKACFLNSTLSFQALQQVEQAIARGEVDVLYVAPERLLQERTLAMLSHLTIALFAIDEAHCVSQWGHDFRAEYLKLGLIAQRFPGVPRVALTATADAKTREEIIEKLHLQQAKTFVSSFDRPNIFYQIQVKNNARQQLLAFIRKEHRKSSGIVYCLSRKKVEATAEWLAGQGFNALPYHAGLDVGVRQTHQARFLREEAVIVVATIAFGMGIDKPDVRFVAHLDLPKSIESYYQETGRAGRDGNASDAWMVYGYQDVVKLKQMMQQSQGAEAFKRVERQKLDALLGFCEVTHCRRNTLLNYFGEKTEKPCGHCDTCLVPPETWDGTKVAQKALSTVYRSGQRFGVAHLIDILVGKKTTKVQQFQHEELSTFGIGSELNAAQWGSVFRQLVAMNYLAVDLSSYGSVVLQESCRAILRGEAVLRLRRDMSTEEESPQGKRQKRRSITATMDPKDMPLWTRLRACRKQLADENGVPPYVIFHDATLLEMLHHQPTSEPEMLALSGIGRNKMDNFGQAFLAVIEKYIEEEFLVSEA